MKLKSDKTLLRKLERLKAPDETILWAARANPKAKTAHKVQNMLLLGLLAIVLVFFFRQLAHFNPGRLTKFGLIALFLIFRLLGSVVGPTTFLFKKLMSSIFNVEQELGSTPAFAYGFSDKRTFMFHGPSSKDISAMSYDDIIDIEIRRDLLSRFYNTGTIKFYQGQTREGFGESIAKIYVDWFHISEATEVHKLLLKTMLSAKYKHKRSFNPVAPVATVKPRVFTKDYQTEDDLEILVEIEKARSAGALYRSRIENRGSKAKIFDKQDSNKRPVAEEFFASNTQKRLEEEDYSKEFEAMLEANEKKQLEV